MRIGDKSKEMLGENLRNLEYAKGSRHYEDEINSYATLEDLDNWRREHRNKSGT